MKVTTKLIYYNSVSISPFPTCFALTSKVSGKMLGQSLLLEVFLQNSVTSLGPIFYRKTSIMLMKQRQYEVISNQLLWTFAEDLVAT